MNELTATSPEVIKELAKHGIKPGANGQPAVPADSRQKLPKTTPTPEPLKAKKFMVELEPAELLRLEREASNRQQTPREYLQEIVSDALKGSIGKAYVSSPSNMGKRVTAPSNTYGRNLKD